MMNFVWPDPAVALVRESLDEAFFICYRGVNGVRDVLLGAEAR